MDYSKILKAAGVSFACLSAFALGLFVNANFKLDVSIKKEGEVGLGKLIDIKGKSEQEVGLSAKKDAVSLTVESDAGTDNTDNDSSIEVADYIRLSNENDSDETETYTNNTENLIKNSYDWSTRLFDGVLADFYIQPDGNQTVCVYQVSDKTYEAKVIYRNLDLVPGQTYTIEFDAYCKEGTGVIGAGIMEEQTWESDAYSELNLTTEKTHFIIKSDPVSNYNYPMRLFIDYGFETGTYKVENISIKLS